MGICSGNLQTALKTYAVVNRSFRISNLILILIFLVCSQNAISADNLNIFNVSDKFFESVKQGDLATVKYIAETHPDTINQTNKEGQSAAHIAVLNGHKDVLEFLLKTIDTNVVDKEKRTLLHYVAFSPNEELAGYLLEKGVILKAKDESGETATHKAVKAGRLNMLKFLVSKGASIDELDNDGLPALHKACCPFFRDIKESGLTIDSRLTQKELQLVKLLAENFTNKAAANTLGVSIKTIDARRRAIMEKLGITGIADLTKYAIRKVITTPD